MVQYRHRLSGGNGSPVGKDFVEIVRQLADETGVAMPAHEGRQSGDRSTQDKRETSGQKRTRERHSQISDSNDDDEKLNRLAVAFEKVEAEWGEHLRLNTLTKQVELDTEAIETGLLRLKLATEFNLLVPRGDAEDIVISLAKKQAYSPIAEYLEQVRKQHGASTSILDKVATRHFGTSDPLYDTYVKRMMVGAVARIFQPGCKLDTTLILQGDQGLLKSSWFRELAGPDWFDDSLGSPSDKDERLKLHSAWFNEWGELETVFKRKESAAVKAFLSCSTDNFRVPYGRQVESFPRQSIIVGTTNQQEFLSDPTGDRRYWIIPIKKRIDINLLRQERDRLWAAAVELYKRGEQWYLTDAESEASAEVNQNYHTDDVWTQPILNYVGSKQFVTTSEILTHALEIEIGRQDRASQMRTADILKRLGWSQKTKAEEGHRVRGWTLTQPTQPLSEVVSEVVQAESQTEQGIQPTDTTSEHKFFETTAVVNLAKDEKEANHLDAARDSNLSIFRQPALQLSEVLKIAETWEEVEDAIATAPEHKQAAWKLLSEAEQKRLKALKPASPIGELTASVAFKAGDRVIWDNAPAHTKDLSPFKIISVDGDTAKLDMFERSIPLIELRRVK